MQFVSLPRKDALLLNTRLSETPAKCFCHTPVCSCSQHDLIKGRAIPFSLPEVYLACGKRYGNALGDVPDVERNMDWPAIACFVAPRFVRRSPSALPFHPVVPFVLAQTKKLPGCAMKS